MSGHIRFKSPSLSLSSSLNDTSSLYLRGSDPTSGVGSIFIFPLSNQKSLLQKTLPSEALLTKPFLGQTPLPNLHYGLQLPYHSLKLAHHYLKFITRFTSLLSPQPDCKHQKYGDYFCLYQGYGVCHLLGTKWVFVESVEDKLFSLK